MNRFILALPLALAACAPAVPPAIVAYDVPYVAKWQPGDPRPMARPEVAAEARQRIWPACDKWPDDCQRGLFMAFFEDEGGNVHGPFFETVTEVPPATPRQDVPAFDFTPELPGPAPAPEPQPEAEPQPEPTPEPEPQPETDPEPESEPQPEPEKPTKKEQPA